MLAIQTEKPLAMPIQVLLVDNVHNHDLTAQFIRRSFSEAYGASIHPYAKHLIAAVDSQARIQAALGFQRADQGALFLEQYLDLPIEQALEDLGGCEVKRRRILEVGNLASRATGNTRLLILSLANYFYLQGMRWLVLTATPRVLNSFQKLGLGLEFMSLAPADPQRLQDRQQCWGRYYQEQPVVVAARIDRGIRRLKRNPQHRWLLQQVPRPQRDTGVSFRELQR